MADNAPADDQDVELKPDFSGGIYNCKWKKFERPGIVALGKWKSGYIPDNSRVPKDAEELEKHLPRKKVSFLTDPPEDLHVTWIGHASLLVQFEGLTILTDPVFETYCGPQYKIINKFGYKRYREAACQVDDLKHLDVVIISHNHFDHLESTAVEKISKKFPKAKWYVTEGTADCINRWASKLDVEEVTWWEQKEFEVKSKKFKFVCLPSQHWCQRGMLDMNKCLWGSWAVLGEKKKFYFAGDTGYFEALFKKIGERYGPFDLAAIPIGAYEPREILAYQHVNPEEAVKIHIDVQSRQSIGIHWGTFCLSNEFYLEPPNKVEEEMKKKGQRPENFISLCHGETWKVGSERNPSPFMNPEWCRQH